MNKELFKCIGIMILAFLCGAIVAHLPFVIRTGAGVVACCFGTWALWRTLKENRDI